MERLAMERLNPATTALVLIDLQHGTVGRALAPYSGQLVVDTSVQLARRLAAAGGVLAVVRIAWSADGGDRPGGTVDEPMALPPGGLPAAFVEPMPEVAALTPDIAITKRHWGAFGGTELDLQLRRRGVRTVVLCGIATNFGVESTAREAWQANYDVVIAADACTTVTEEMHRFSLTAIMPRIARVRTVAEIGAAFG